MASDRIVAGLPLNSETPLLQEVRAEVDRDGLELEQWNQPRINIYRYLSTLYAFMAVGMNDAAYGVSDTDHMISDFG